MMAKITMQEIAEIAGVSKTAVSYAFNYPERISKETLQKILKIAEELDFIPDPIARSMSTGIIGIIGVLVPHPLPEMLANPGFTIFLEGLGEALKEDKASLMLVPPLEGSLTRAVANASVDAFIAYDLKESRNVAQILQARRIPFVTVDTDPIHDISGVLADDISSAEQMMKLVIEQGHQTISIIALEPLEALAETNFRGTVHRRMMGFQRAISAAGDIVSAKINSCKCTLKDAHALFQKLWEDGDRPTAVVTMSDIIAMGVIDQAKQMGLRIPQDLAVTGFDDIPGASYFDPPLTSISQDHYEKGRVAGDLLLKSRDSLLDKAQFVHFKTELVIRKSL
ncbi:MAG: LacI family transcriptional regulator [Chloroflexi bacterium]|nr:LacI family transcriptional regulator [Chloroflexota bacterium]